MFNRFTSPFRTRSDHDFHSSLRAPGFHKLSLWTRTHHTAPKPGALTQLPVEILIHILCQLALPDIVNCRLVRCPHLAYLRASGVSLTSLQLSRHVREVVDGSHEVQVKIELQIAGYDDWCGPALPSAEQLRYINTLQRRWKTPSFEKGPHIPAHILERMKHKKYFSNLFVGCSRTHSLPDPRLWNIICCACVETKDRLAGQADDEQGNFELSHWELRFADGFETFTVDPARKLLVLFRNRPGSVEQEWWYEYVSTPL